MNFYNICAFVRISKPHIEKESLIGLLKKICKTEIGGINEEESDNNKICIILEAYKYVNIEAIDNLIDDIEAIADLDFVEENELEYKIEINDNKFTNYC